MYEVNFFIPFPLLGRILDYNESYKHLLIIRFLSELVFKVIPSFFIFFPWRLLIFFCWHQNQLYELWMIDLKRVNPLMMTSEITKLAPLPRPSKNQLRTKMFMSSLNTDNRRFSCTPKDKFHYQWTIIQ